MLCEFRGDGHKCRRDLVIEAFEGNPLDDLAPFDLLAEPAHLAALHEVRHFLRAGHIELADVVRELDAVLQYDLFSPATGEVERNFRGRFVLERFAAPRIRPATDAA